MFPLQEHSGRVVGGRPGTLLDSAPLPVSGFDPLAPASAKVRADDREGIVRTDFQKPYREEPPQDEHRAA